tara:strand:- start:950 stop:1099 length:150 start_codon:yes stop_codon:yes gene_type:complete
VAFAAFFIVRKNRISPPKRKSSEKIIIVTFEINSPSLKACEAIFAVFET